MADIALNAAANTKSQIIPVGLSMGGLVALQMWRQAPERLTGIVLCGTDPSADSPARAATRAQQMQVATSEGLSALLDLNLNKYFVPSDATTTTALHACARAMAQQQGLPKLIAQHAALATREDCWSLLPSITVPALILCGDAEQICLPETHERMAAAMPNAIYKNIPKAAHLAPLQQPQQVAQYIDDWLAHEFSALP